MDENTHSPSGSESRYAVVARDRAMLRALMDLPAFAGQVIPVAHEDYFVDPAAGIAFSLMAEGYRQHGVVPDCCVLFVMNDGVSHTSEGSVQAVADVIRHLEAMTPIPPDQLPVLLTTAEEWLRRKMIEATWRRIISAESDGVDPRPLTDELKAAYDWHFDSTVKPGRFAVKSHDDLLKAPMTPFLAQNIVVQNSLVALVAPPGCNKTFLALDLALSIASGQPTWLGQPLHVSGPVVYVLGEGAGRFKARVQAWDQEHGIAASYPFHYVNEAVPLTKGADATAFVREVAVLKPVLVVFDTLSRCMAGADENSQRDMSAAVGVCDSLRTQLGCCVLLLHHTTKDGGTERGSSVLKGAVDTLITLKVSRPADPAFTMTCDKQKDAPPFADIVLRRESVTLPSAPDYAGEPTTSCVIRVATAGQVVQRAEGDLWRARKYMASNPDGTRTELAAHLGGRRTDAMKQIAKWVEHGDLHFSRGRQSRPSELPTLETVADDIVN